MDVLTVFAAMAQHWLRAAGDAVNDELRACYTTRAAEYLELASRARAQPVDRNPREAIE